MIYFDNAATTFPKPETVYKAIDEYLRSYCGNPGRSGHRLSLHSGRVLLEARELLSELFNTSSPDRIVFTLNATDSVNIALKGYLSSGDHIIMTSMEHNAVARPVKQLEHIGVENTIVQCDEQGRLNTEDIKKAFKQNTKLLVATHASNVTGTIMPIYEMGKLAAENNIKFMVDAAQTSGVYDIDVKKMNINILVFTGHKSLYGVPGVGGLYIDESVDLIPVRVGGTGSYSESLLQPEIYPDRLESGTPNTPGIVGLCEGIRFINKTGIENIRKHEEDLTRYFINELKNIDDIKIYGPEEISEHAPVVSINIGNIGSSEMSYMLDSSFNIATRPGLHCSPLAHRTIGTLQQGTVRFSFGYFNTKDEIREAIDAINTIVREI
ncbi:MAG: aminotransferase class V-fold PLP-dependent enzyme [Bacillota bacterium]